MCGRSIYAEGTVDAVLFLAKKVEFIPLFYNCSSLDDYTNIKHIRCGNIVPKLVLYINSHVVEKDRLWSFFGGDGGRGGGDV